MKNYWKKIRPFIMGLLVFTFFITVSVSSCNSKKSADQTEKEQTEHPASDNEHPASEEHPADTVKTGGDEHPASEEHPSN